MTYQSKESAGGVLGYIADVTGWSDVVDEWNTARADNHVSIGEWAKIGWQSFGMIPETATNVAFVEPIKALWKGGMWWDEEVSQPLVTSLVMTLGAPGFKQQGESYGEYLQKVRAGTWGSDPGEENWISPGTPVGHMAAEIMSAGMGVEHKGYIFDPIYRRQLREDPVTGKVIGFYDFALPFFDPSLGAIGPASKALKAASAAPKLVSRATAQSAKWWERANAIDPERFIQNLEAGNYAGQVGKIADSTPDIPGYLQMASDWGVRDPASFAFLANKVRGEEHAEALLRVLIDHDETAAQVLREAYGGGTELMAKAVAGDSNHAWRSQMATGEEIIFNPKALEDADDLVKGMDATPTGQRLLDDAQMFVSGIEKLSDAARPNTLRAPASEATILGRKQVYGTNIAGRTVGGMGKRMEKAGKGIHTYRVTEEILDEAGNVVGTQAKLIPYRPVAAHPASWFLERPSGLVRPENPDSFREVIAQIREADRVTGGQMTANGYGNLIMDEWTKASALADPASARGVVVHKLNELTISLLAKKHGIDDPKVVQAMFEHATNKSTQALETFRKKGWLALALDDGAMGIIRSPLLQRTTPNAVQTWDLVKLDKAFTRWNAGGSGRVLRAVTSGAVDAADSLNSLFKISVLLRLGYTLRNLTEATWSIAATGNLGHVLSSVGEERLATMMSTVKATGARLIDRIGARAGSRLSEGAQDAKIVANEALEAASLKMADDMVRMIAFADLDAMIATGDAAKMTQAAHIARARLRLEQEGVTFHAAPRDFALDPERPLTTSGSEAMAARMADQAWESMEVAQFSPTGTKRGLQGPHPDIGRGPYGRRQAAQYHGTLEKWAGDHPDPDLRGDVAPMQEAFNDEALAAPGLYNTDRLATAQEYGGGAYRPDPDSQVYTVIWKHFRPPVLLDGDKPVRELHVVQTWLDGWFDDLDRVIDDITPEIGTFEADRMRARLKTQRALAKDPTLSPISDVEGSALSVPPSARPAVDLLNGTLKTIAKADEMAEWTGLTPGQVIESHLQDLRATLREEVGLSALTPRQREIYDRIVDEVDRVADDIESIDTDALLSLAHEMQDASPAAYQWGSGWDEDATFLGPAAKAWLDVFGSDLMTTAYQGYLFPNAGKGAIAEFMRKHFDVDDMDAWAAGLSDRIYADASHSVGYQAVWGKINAAFAKHLTANGFDGVRHTGGLNAPKQAQHGVMIFLRADDVRVVGQNWLDYDNQKVLAAAREMALELRDRLQAGQRVRRVNYDRRTGRGVVADDLPGAVDYKEVTLAEAEAWVADPVALTRAFGYNPKKPSAEQDFRKQFQTLDPDKAMEVTPIRSYGRELDLSTADWPAVPQEVRDIMGWKRTRGKTKGGKPRSGSFSRDMRAIRNGDTEVRDRVTKALNEAGYQRVILPDSNAFGGRQVVINPKYVGDEGLQRTTQDYMDSVAAQVSLPAEAPVSPMTRRQRRAENRKYREDGNPNPQPIIDEYNQNMAQSMINGGLDGWVEELLSSRQRIRAELDTLRAMKAERIRRYTPERFGTRDVRIASQYGEDYVAAGPLGGHAGELWARMTSSDEANQRLFFQSDAAGRVGGQGTPSVIPPDHPRYYEGWSNILNKHFRDEGSRIADPVVSMFLEGRSVEEITRWATRTPEGFQWARSIGLNRSATVADFGKPGSVARRAEAIEEARKKVKTASIDPDTIEEAVVALEMAVDLYLPAGPIRDAFATGADITADTLRRGRQGLENSPIHGLLIPTSKEARLNWGLNDYARAGMEKTMRALGTLPETSFARHPLFVTMAKDEYARRIALAEERVGRRLTVGEINNIINDSRHAAKLDLERTLYTVIRKSGFAEATRLLFPFAAAYENSLRRWGNFIKSDPALPFKAGNLAARASRPFPVIDENGEEIPLSEATFDSYIVLPGLDSLAGFLPGSLGRAAQAESQNIHVKLSSLDLITQGEPFNPGFGPFVLFPVSEILKRKPTTEKLLGWTMPYGVPQDAIDLFLPTVLRRIKSMATEDTTYTNAFTKAYLYQQWLYETGQRDTEPTLTEIRDTTDSLYVLRILTNLTAPFSAQFTNERDFYVNKLREYRDTYESYDEAEARFFADFPDAAMLVQSLSRNESGAMATERAYENLTAYEQEVMDAYALGDPELAGFIANYGSGPGDEFSGAVYRWEREYTPVPGSDETLRKVQNPEEAVREAHVSDGWRTWRRYMESAEAQLVASGLGPDSPIWNEVMSKFKPAVAEAIYNSGNQDWWFEYKDPDTAKYFRRAAYFEELVSNSDFMDKHGNDTLMRSISNYLVLRRRYIDAVNYLASQGGQRSLSGELERQWNATVDQMRLDSPEFSAWVDRYFQNDPVVGGQPIARAA